MITLWSDKYKPVKLAEICGQNKAVEKVSEWLREWKRGYALLVCGPTGSGKTLIAEAIAKERNWQLLRLNASEISSEMIEEVAGGSKTRPLFFSGKLILIDELEGISGRDRGVMPAIVELIKQSRYPVILVSSDPYLQKLSSVKNYCDSLKLDKVAVPSIAKRLGEIAKSEGIEVDVDVLKALAKFSQGDLRSAINDFQSAAHGRKKLTMEDLAGLGYREREQPVFNTLQPIFHSRSVSAGRNAMMQSDKDADDVFWWIENNILAEMKTVEEIQKAYGLLSIADLLRQKVSKQQNWRFKAIYSDLISSISVYKISHTGFVMYKPPQRLIQLGRSREQRAALASLAEKLGSKFHCSKKLVKSAHLPYLKLLKTESLESLGLEKEELDIILK